MVLQELQAAHGCTVSSFTAAALAVEIVKKIGTVNAESQANVVSLDEVTPGLVQQRAVGLNGMNNVWSRWRDTCDGCQCLFVPGDWHGQGFARVPNDRQLAADELRRVSLLDRALEDLHAHAAR